MQGWSTYSFHRFIYNCRVGSPTAPDDVQDVKYGRGLAPIRVVSRSSQLMDGSLYEGPSRDPSRIGANPNS